MDGFFSVHCPPFPSPLLPFLLPALLFSPPSFSSSSLLLPTSTLSLPSPIHPLSFKPPPPSSSLSSLQTHGSRDSAKSASASLSPGGRGQVQLLTAEPDPVSLYTAPSGSGDPAHVTLPSVAGAPLVPGSTPAGGLGGRKGDSEGKPPVEEEGQEGGTPGILSLPECPKCLLKIQILRWAREVRWKPEKRSGGRGHLAIPMGSVCPSPPSSKKEPGHRP